MIALLGRLLRCKPTPDADADDLGAAPARYEPTIQEEFCRTVELRPGVPLMAHLAEHGPAELRTWLSADRPDPEAQSIMAAAVEMARAGHGLWEARSLTIHSPGRPEHDGGPAPWTVELTALLADLLGRRVVLCHRNGRGEEFRQEFGPAPRDQPHSAGASRTS